MIDWDGDVSTWSPPSDCDAIASDTANIGDSYDAATDSFTASPAPADPLASDLARLYSYMPISGSAVAQAVNAFIADTTKDAATRATMAALRSMIRVLWTRDANS